MIVNAMGIVLLVIEKHLLLKLFDICLPSDGEKSERLTDREREADKDRHRDRQKQRQCQTKRETETYFVILEPCHINFAGSIL